MSLLLYIVFSALLNSQPAAVISQNIPSCPITLPAEWSNSGRIRCEQTTLPLLHERPHGEQIQTPVIVVRAEAPTAPPVVLLQGGPGGSGLDFFLNGVAFTPLGQALLQQHDLVIIEQRGTRYAQPALMCPEVFEAERMAAQSTAGYAATLEILYGAHLACRQRLIAEGIDLNAFTAEQISLDVIATVDRLGYSEFYLYGISYGSLIAQYTLRLAGERVRGVILDAVVPAEIDLLAQVPRHFERSLKAVFAACEQEAPCLADFPDLERRYLALVDQLNAAPVTVTTLNGTLPLEISGADLVDLTQRALYVTGLIADLPRAIYQMSEGDFSWLSQWGGALLFSQGLAHGVYHSALCADDGNFALEAVDTTGDWETLLDTLARAPEMLARVCARWGVTPLPAAFDAPVISDVPTLLFSGQFDPVAPPEAAEIVGRWLPNRYTVTFPQAGHGSLLAGSCPGQIVLAFLNDPASVPQAAECVDNLAPHFSHWFSDSAGLFEVATPGGWLDQSVPDAAIFFDPTSGATSITRLMPTADRAAAIEMALTAAGFAGALRGNLPAEINLPTGDWLQTPFVYQEGLILAMALTDGAQTLTVLLYAPGGQASAAYAGLNTPLMTARIR